MTVPDAMKLADFSKEEQQDPAKQMWIRRRIKKHTTTSLTTPTTSICVDNAVRDSGGVSSLSTSAIASPPKKRQGPDGQQQQRRLVVRKLLHKNDYTTHLNKGVTVFVEPGRSIVASAAVTLYSVGTIKSIPGVRTYVAVDGGMSDNPRPVMYGSGYEAFLPARSNADRTEVVRLVGKHCESGDVLINEALVPTGLTIGDVLATPVTGAYGHTMASNYNKVTRPPVVFVSNGNARLVVRRETNEDLTRLDIR
jgi:hypothetical protein